MCLIRSSSDPAGLIVSGVYSLKAHSGCRRWRGWANIVSIRFWTNLFGENISSVPISYLFTFELINSSTNCWKKIVDYVVFYVICQAKMQKLITISSPMWGFAACKLNHRLSGVRQSKRFKNIVLSSGAFMLYRNNKNRKWTTNQCCLRGIKHSRV